MTTFTCPHCDNDFNISFSDIGEREHNGYITDYQCPHCNETMDIAVSMIWTGDAIIVENQECDCCNKNFRKRDLHKRGSCYPYPVNKSYNKLCSNCYGTSIYVEMNERADAVAGLTEEIINTMKNQYHNGDKVVATIIQSPYYFSETPRNLLVVEVDELGLIWTLDESQNSIKLCYGYDAFEKVNNNG